ncbi:unnamed protein product [Hermetia illucens]|uniref:Lipase n=2 Tax=Hermetia illucens TaxID=343691 RepID=A0A7R8UDW6_HERIL|nr:unnamed protein product [Hermetia illucens]
MTFFSVLVFSVVLLNSVNSSQTFEIFTRATDAFKSFLNIELITVDKPRSTGDSNETDSVAEDATLLAPDLIRKYQYPVEVHNVTTDDGYILQVFRIPKPDQQPVLLMHGLLDTSDTWILMGPQQGLAYLLSDLGYDVWMGNVRGNRYSNRHSILSPMSRKYWDFSLDEIGYYDIPAIVDHVLNQTNYPKLHYIGHSQGNAVFFVMCSERPEYANKIYSMHGLAPIAFFSTVRSPVINSMVASIDFLRILTATLRIYEFLPNSEFLTKSTRIMCHDASIVQAVCSNMLFLLAGFNTDQLNKTMLPVALGHTPSGASVKQMIHFAQLIKSGHFRKYDYGRFRNDMRYGTTEPPDYNLLNVKMPVSLYYSENDWLLDVESVQKLSTLLPNVQDKYLIPLKQFNHLDFCWAVDGRKIVYGRLLENMQIAESNGNLFS